MNRSLLLVTLCLFAAPGHSMTASVAPSTSAGSPTTQGAAAKGNVATADSATKAVTTNAAPGVSAAPAPASVTRPAAVVSAPGVPMKATAATGVKPGAAPSRATVFMPSATSQSGAMAPPPNSKAWAATARTDSAMRRGTLQTVNVNPGTFQVHGQKLNFNPQQVKVFNSDGRPGSIFALKSGAKVRFMLDPKDPAQRRVAVIYVD